MHYFLESIACYAANIALELKALLHSFILQFLKLEISFLPAKTILDILSGPSKEVLSVKDLFKLKTTKGCRNAYLNYKKEKI